MKMHRHWLLIALPLVAVACGGEGEEGAEMAGTADSAAVMPTDTGMGSMAAMPSTLALQPVGGGSATGQATLTPEGGQTRVAIQLTGLPPGARPGHIHAGTCEAIGDVVQPLPTITADAGGAGTADSTVAIDAATVMDGQHVIAYHGEGGTPVTCGTISGHAM